MANARRALVVAALLLACGGGSDGNGNGDGGTPAAQDCEGRNGLCHGSPICAVKVDGVHLDQVCDCDTWVCVQLPTKVCGTPQDMCQSRGFPLP